MYIYIILLSLIPLVIYILASLVGYYTIFRFSDDYNLATQENPSARNKIFGLTIAIPIIYVIFIWIIRSIGGDLTAPLMLASPAIWGLLAFIGMKVILDPVLATRGSSFTVIIMYLVGTFAAVMAINYLLIKLAMQILYMF